MFIWRIAQGEQLVASGGVPVMIGITAHQPAGSASVSRAVHGGDRYVDPFAAVNLGTMSMDPGEMTWDHSADLSNQGRIDVSEDRLLAVVVVHQPG